jgi:hypothetical protein
VVTEATPVAATGLQSTTHESYVLLSCLAVRIPVSLVFLPTSDSNGKLFPNDRSHLDIGRQLRLPHGVDSDHVVRRQTGRIGDVFLCFCIFDA